MSNGSFYLVTRVKTFASFLAQNESVVLRKVDSLLYENIPGKILKKHLFKKMDIKDLISPIKQDAAIFNDTIFSLPI
jgi:hypothetical protein